jgi:Dolichyl-phosphate-mannose-protein mannosyltransferase
MAQSLLIGYPYLGDIPTRPLYIVLLSFLHRLAGERYNLIIAGQTLILAVIPVLLYYLGKKLHSRTAGVIIALFAIFRELTSLLISSQTRVSNTKTLLVDLPTLLLILAAILLALRWLERKNWRSGLIAGGIFGVLLLLRTQSLLILPVLFLLVILTFGMRDRNWIPALAFFLAGFAITVAPWLLHNYLKSGQLTFDAPFEYQVVASQYKYTGNLDLQNVDLQGKSLAGILLTFALHDPKFVLGFITTHFLSTQINGVLALPLIESYNGLSAPLNLYWMSWDGSLSWYNMALLIIYLLIIAAGLGAVWKRLHWLGLVPLAFSIGYSLANGVGRFSGWRYDLPADWISYFYFGIGTAEIFCIFALIFGAKSEKLFTSILDNRPYDLKWNKGLFVICAITGAFAIIGALPWMVEGLAAPRYSGQTPTQLMTTLSDSTAVQNLGVNRTQIEMFSGDPQTTLQIGRVLYPRFFTRNQGLASSHPWPAYAPRDFPRVGFVMINQSQQNLVFPSRTIPDPFPSASDAIVLGCQRTDYLEVRLILFPDSGAAYMSTPLNVPCN